MRLSTTITRRGPIFDGRASRLGDKFMHDIVEEVTDAGAERLSQVLRPAPAGVFHTLQYAQDHGYRTTGHYRQSIHTEVNGLNGIIDDSQVVYGPWLEGVSSRNTRSRFKGYAAFRRTKEWLDQRMSGIVKGHTLAFIRKMNGV